MLTMTLLAACAHRSPAAAPTLDGGWSSDEITVFVLLEGAEARPAIWVERGELLPAGAIVRQDNGAVQFRLTEGPPATVTIALSEDDALLLIWADDDGGQPEHHSLTRTTPHSTAALEQEWADQAAAAVAWNVEAIRTAELAHFFALDTFLPAEIWPRSVASLTPDPVAWPDGSDFEQLGWSPQGMVRGTFEVTVAEDGRELTVHGWQDLDGDGVPAHWTATRQLGVKRISAAGAR